MADNRNFIQRLFNMQVEEEKNVGTNMMGYFGVGSEEPRNYKYQDLAKEGYLKNAIVYRCVNEISKGAAAVPFAEVTRPPPVVADTSPLEEILNTLDPPALMPMVSAAPE